MGNERSVKKSDSRCSVSADWVEAMEVDFFTNAANEVSDLQSKGCRAQDHILERTEPEVVDLAVHRHDVLVAVLVNSLADHVSSVILGMRLHPRGGEGLVECVSMSIEIDKQQCQSSP